MKAEAPIWKGKGTNKKRGPTSNQENITQKRKHRTKAANQPICSKVQQARASAITQGN
jgi:hypothetical protein